MVPGGVVFFDWWGTLAGPAPGYRPAEAVWADVAETLGGVRLTEREVRERTEAIDPEWQARMYRYFGRSEEFWHDYNSAVMNVLGIEQQRDAVDRRVSATLGDPHLQRLFPEVRDVLASLRARGHRLGVISNSSERLLAAVRYLELDSLLDPVVLTQEVGAQKPDRRVFEFAVRRAGVGATAATHVGDSYEADYLGARGAGLRAIWLNRSGKPAPADCESVQDLRELLPLLP